MKDYLLNKPAPFALNYWSFSIIILFVISCSSQSYESSFETIEKPWQGSWIRPVDLPDSSNTWSAFRKKFDVREKEKAFVRLAVDSKYWMWLNDSLIVREGQLKRGPTPLDTYYDEVEVTDHLKEGQNTISILMWYFGKDGFSHRSSGRAGLIAEVWNEKGLIAATDSTWKAIPHPAFLRESAPPQPNWRLSESNIVFDAQQDIPEWHTLDFDDSQWPNAISIGQGECKPWGDLVKRPIPQWKDFRLKDFVSINGEDTLIAQLPYNAQLTPFLKVDAIAGKRIVMFTDHYKGGSEYNMRAEYITKSGVQEFESPGWINGHNVYYVIPEGVEVHKVKYRESGYNTEFTGSFSCDDDFYNLLWQKAARTLYVTMRDNYMDCPDRERAQWWGDEVLEGGEAFYALDRRADALMRKGMLELVNWQKSDSSLFSPIPAGSWDKELPGQMLMSVGSQGFWNYYMHTGDLETIRQVYEPVKRYLAIWKLKENGTLTMRQGGWFWGDWGPNKDMVLLLNTQYALAISGLQRMASELGETKDADSLAAHFDRFKVAFNEIFWKGDHYRSNNYKGPTDDRSQGLAVVAGLAGSDKYESIYQVFQEQMNGSPYMEKYVLESLFMMGYSEFALERMKTRFSKMVNHPTISTLWEGWGIGAEGYGGGTTNHAWSGGGLTLLAQKVAGIDPIAPGYKRFQVKPQLGGLTQVKTEVQSAQGLIKVEIDATEGFQMDLVVPTGSECVAYIPEEHSKIKVNGEAKEFAKSGGHIMIKLIAGEYSLVAR